MTALREIPSVSQILQAAGDLLQRFGAGVAKLELGVVLDGLREQIVKGNRDSTPSLDEIVSELERRLLRLMTSDGRRAINATGILLHTGLGRSPLCKEAIEAMATAGGYSLLQASLDTGDRSLREEKIQRMLIDLVGCEAATIVNNNAAATMLILNTLASGKEVELGRKYKLPVVEDLGSGALVPLKQWGLSNEPLVRDSLAASAEVLFLGDKLICGPQAGLICGKLDWIERIRKNPYARMFRVCKLTLAGWRRRLRISSTARFARRSRSIGSVRGSWGSCAAARRCWKINWPGFRGSKPTSVRAKRAASSRLMTCLRFSCGVG